MKIIKKTSDMKSYRNRIKGKIGFVPTMGALHNGHLSLIERAKKENDIVIVSIYLNPTQFNDPKDLERYPKKLQQDIKLLREKKINCLFLPSYKEIYPDNYSYKIVETKDSQILCGKFRPGHFEGVLTVVMKLFNIIKPNKAYFGHKDFQQYILIKKMIKAFFMDIDIVGCPTIREKDGLAMSSRNMLLDDISRKKAPLLYKVIKNNKISNEEGKKILQENGFDVEYLENHWGRRFVAARIGEVRLIDNVKIRS